MIGRRQIVIFVIVLSVVGGVALLRGQTALERRASSQVCQPTAKIEEPVRLALEGSVVGDLEPFAVKHQDLEASILKYPAPKIFLVFNSSGQKVDAVTAGPGNDPPIKVELSDEVKAEIMFLWRAELEYFFKSKVKGLPDAQTQFDEDAAILRLIVKTTAQLQQLSVNAPDGSRNLSEDEAEGIVQFLGLAASNVAEQSRP